MPSPMPHDSLGRIVYEGDYAVGWTIDLKASPKRTNYERYFADLGTYEEVINAIYAICDGTPPLLCRNCVFYNWVELFWCGIDRGCYSFDIWLDETAVI